MATTRARQARRAIQRAKESFIDKLLDEYTANPNAALRKCYEHFGKDRFENALKIYMHQHVVQTAMALAIKHCVKETA
jgi:hypothetical protein